MRKQVIAPLTAGVLLALAGAAQAATKTATITVTAQVVDNCVISAENLALGVFDGTNDLASDADITVSCTDGTDYTVDLSTGSSANYATRELAGPAGSTLFYNLFTSGTYATIWGDTTGATGRASGLGAGMASSSVHTVYGRLLATDNTGPVEAGAYTDTITATITY
jgi:spore coat protein U-like protein